jgi:hypothetical protein
MPVDTTLILVLAVIVAASRPVRISSLRIDVIPIHPFVLLALALEGGGAAGLVGVAGVLGGAIFRRPRPAAKRLVYNIGVSVVSTSAAAWAAGRLGGHPDAPVSAWVGPLAVATLVYFVVGTALVATAISIEKRQGLLATWNRSLRWTALPYAMGFTVALAALAACEVSYGAGILLMIAPCWCLVLAYRSEARRHAPAGTRL